MNAPRSTAVVSGLVLIVATVAAVLAAGIKPVMTGPDYLTHVAAHGSEVAASVLLYLIAAFGSAGIAVSLYPVLGRTKERLAIGSVVFRTLEAALYLVPVVCLLSLVTLGHQAAAAGTADQAAFTAVGGVLVSLGDHGNAAAILAFSLGAGMYYVAFFQSRLVPRWLSGWGIVAVILMAAAGVSSVFTDQPVTGYALLILPIFVQEMVLAVWLIVKGFNSTTAVPSGSTVQQALASA